MIINDYVLTTNNVNHYRIFNCHYDLIDIKPEIIIPTSLYKSHVLSEYSIITIPLKVTAFQLQVTVRYTCVVFC